MSARDIGDARPRYLFAYGSLIQHEARVKTVPLAGRAFPAVVHGLRRGWWFQYGPELGPTLSPTYLGAQADPGATCNGVVFQLPDAGLERLYWRELGYIEAALDPADVEVLADDISLANVEIVYFASERRDLPSVKHPIIQKYVDICVGGCIEVEEAFPEARAAGFSRQFLETTIDWQGPWMNDRLQPWQPFLEEPRAREIDALLHDVLGPERFAQIRVPGY